MSKDGIGLECVKVKEVGGFADRYLARPRHGEVVPVSRWRCRAWANNPIADADDVALVVAYHQGRCAGYIGVLPGQLRAGGEVHKVYWYSTFWVPPELRPTGVGAMLILKTLTMGRDIVVTGLSRQAGQLYEALRFRAIGPLRYWTADLRGVRLGRMPLRLARKAARLSGRETPRLDRLIDAPGPRGFHPLGWGARGAMRRSLGGGEAERVDRICDSAFETLQDRWAPVRFSRPVAVVNWMLEDKWVTTNERDATLGYEFTDYHALFEYHAYRLTGGPSGEDRGFAVLRIDDVGGHRSVTVFDHHVNDPAGYDQLLGLALDRAEAFRTDYVHVPFQCQPYIERSWFTRHIFRPSERAYYGHPVSKESPLARAIGELTLDLSDGDLAFA